MDIEIRGQAWGFTGFATALRNIATGLDALKANVKIVSTNAENCDEKVQKRDIIHRLLKNSVERPIFIGTGPPFLLEIPKNSRYNIAYTMFEALQMPASFADKLNAFDEVWVPSQVNKELFSQVYPADKIFVMPLGVDTGIFNPTHKKLNFMNPNGLRILMFGRWCSRKGFHLGINAFLRAFEKHQATLMIGTYYTDKKHVVDMINNFRNKLKEKELPNIIFTTVRLEETTLPGLYTDCDIGLFPSSGEGFCLPAAECMSSGKPIIVPEFSAMSDFCNKENGYLIENAEPTSKYPEYGSMSTHYKGLQFQNPRLDSLIYTLQNIAVDRDMIERKGKRSRTTIENKFSLEVVSKKYHERLNKIWLTTRNAH